MEPRIQYAKTEDGVSVAFTPKLPEVAGRSRGLDLDTRHKYVLAGAVLAAAVAAWTAPFFQPEPACRSA